MRVQVALEEIGFQCDLASDGDEALLRLSECKYHVVVTELVLPGISGGQLILELRARESAPVLVVYTRELDQEVYRALKQEGVDGIFYKPADCGSMARKIQTLVAGRNDPRTAVQRLKRWQNGTTAANQVTRLLRQGDSWIQNSSVRVEAFRFLIIVLACVLLGLGWGNSLDPSMAGICKMFGLCGLAFYFCLVLVAYQRDLSRKAIRHCPEGEPANPHREFVNERLPEAATSHAI